MSAIDSQYLIPFTDEHEMVRETVRGLVNDRIAPRAVSLDESHAFPHEAMQELAELDLQERREGDVLGLSQSGRRASLRFLSLAEHRDLIVDARQLCASVHAADPDHAGDWLIIPSGGPLRAFQDEGRAAAAQVRVTFG